MPINPETFKKMFDQAQAALQFSYSPYSQCRVSAALLTESGEVITGCNIENASYGGTICAERVAVFKSVSSGHKKFKSILVMTEASPAWTPCGFCRQVLAEFGDPSMPVYCTNPKGETKEFSLGSLLPEAFSKKDL